MKVKELIKLLQQLDLNKQIKLEDMMHNLIPIYNIVGSMLVHEEKDIYVITPFEYGAAKK